MIVFLKKHFFVFLALWSVALLVVAGFVGASVVHYIPFLNPDAGSELRIGGHGLTNPLLECDIGGYTIGARKEDFTPELTSFVDVLKQKTGLTDVSVYFRDLNNGPVIGINQNENFSPASLLKVPIMLTYYSRAETDPAILATQIDYLKENAKLAPDVQTITPEQSITVGHTYSVNELIEHMIKYSDNQAMALLYEHLPIEEQVNLYTLLGVDPSVITDPSAALTVRQYSIFFRILFNASFLSRVHSEQALKLLSETTFDNGMRAGVPAKIMVAHKFGERRFGDSLQQLHDCGVVYYPNHPYLLCLMTRGENTSALENGIAEISRFVYDQIDSQYGE